MYVDDYADIIGYILLIICSYCLYYYPFLPSTYFLEPSSGHTLHISPMSLLASVQVLRVMLYLQKVKRCAEGDTLKKALTQLLTCKNTVTMN